MFALKKYSVPKLSSLLSISRNGGSIPVILLGKLENKGQKGEIISVKRGFARNFLIPKKFAGMSETSFSLFWLFDVKSQRMQLKQTN